VPFFIAFCEKTVANYKKRVGFVKSCELVSMGCASSKQFKRAPPHEDAAVLAKETTCMFAETLVI
jgi:hypothetical protein